MKYPAEYIERATQQGRELIENMYQEGIKILEEQIISNAVPQSGDKEG